MAAETNVAFDLLMGFAKDAEGQGEDAIIDAIFDAVFQGTPFAGLFDNGDTALIDKLSEQIQQLTENCREYFLAQTSINIDEQANPLGVHWVNVLDDWSSNYKSQATFEDYFAQNPAPFGKYDPITKKSSGYSR